MKLNTGKIAFPIEFDNGDKDYIYFNPNDPNLAIRLGEMGDRIKEKVNGLSDINITKDGVPKDEKSFDRFKEIQEYIFESINWAFGNDISSVVFKYCSPFAIVDGDYFIFQFVNAITPEVEKHIKKANKDIEKNMKKHIGKYVNE